MIGFLQKRHEDGTIENSFTRLQSAVLLSLGTIGFMGSLVLLFIVVLTDIKVSTGDLIEVMFISLAILGIAAGEKVGMGFIENRRKDA